MGGIAMPFIEWTPIAPTLPPSVEVCARSAPRYTFDGASPTIAALTPYYAETEIVHRRFGEPRGDCRGGTTLLVLVSDHHASSGAILMLGQPRPTNAVCVEPRSGW